MREWREKTLACVVQESCCCRIGLMSAVALVFPLGCPWECPGNWLGWISIFLCHLHLVAVGVWN